MVGQAAVAQVRQRVTDRRQLPVQYRDHRRLGGMNQHVAQSVVAVGDARRLIVGGQVLEQPARQHVHLRHVLGPRGLPLPGPQRHLALHVALWPAEPVKARRAPVDAVQRGKHACQVLVDGGAVLRREAAQGGVSKDSPRNVVHDEKRCADDGFVPTQQPHARYRHIAVGQRRHDAVFALHLVRPGQELARRLLTEHVLAGVGGQVKRRVALAALELADLQGSVEARQSTGQILRESGFVEAVGGQHSHQLRYTLHE